uniref:AMP-binding domain-containing protein n=1 Tax=Heterorhabditis bacteriophora TaxID=37862 RepID=A0A1I7WSJ2_HETBA
MLANNNKRVPNVEHSTMVSYPTELFHIQILDKCEKYGDKIALTDSSGDLTFQEVFELSYRFAFLLHSEGIQKGDSLLVCLHNSSWYPIVFLGSALLGATISGIHPDSTTDYKNINYFTHVPCICIGDAIENSVISVPRDLPKLLNPQKSKEDEKGDVFGLRTPQINLDDVLIMPFSSGTSGKPKCVMLTHKNYNAATSILKSALFDQLVTESQRRTIAMLPFHHGSGFWALLFCLLEGCQTIIMHHFHPMIMLEMIQKYKVDTINIVPSVLGYLSRMPTQNFDISSLKTVLCGSSPLGKGISQTFLEKFPSVENLIQGAFKIVLLSHISPLGKSVVHEQRLGSCGKLLPGYEAKFSSV